MGFESLLLEFPVGQYVLTLSVEDMAGNINASACQLELQVIDNEPPQLVCPYNVTVQVADDGGTSVATWAFPFVTDNVGVQKYNGTAASGDAFTFGATRVTYTAYDTSGNQASCSFYILVGLTAPAAAAAALPAPVLGGLSAAVLLAMVGVGVAVLLLRRSREKMKELEGRANFVESEDMLLIRAQV